VVDGRALTGEISPRAIATCSRSIWSGREYYFSAVSTGGVQFDPYLDLYAPAGGLDRRQRRRRWRTECRHRHTATTSVHVRSERVRRVSPAPAPWYRHAGPLLTASTPSDDAMALPSTAPSCSPDSPVRAGTGDIVLYDANGTVARRIGITNVGQVAIGTNRSRSIRVPTWPRAGYYINIAPG
jgi:hypothetical protein